MSEHPSNPERRVPDPGVGRASESREALSRRRVVLGRIDEDFDPDRDIPIGPMCFAGREALFPAWETLWFPRPFPTAEDRIDADRAARALTNALVPVWAERMNSRHGTTLGNDYWHTLLILWLATSVRSMWYRYRAMEEVVARYRRQEVTVRVFPEENPFGIPDLEAFIDTAYNDEQFGIWADSLILHAIAPESWRLETEAPPPRTDGERKTKATLVRPSLLGSMARRMMGRLAFESGHGVRLWKVPLSLYLEMLPRRKSRPILAALQPAPGEAGFPPAFLTVLDRFLGATIPEAFTVDFRRHLEAAARHRFVPGRLSVENLSSPFTPIRFILAQAQESGERLVGLQHGTAYGSARLMSWAPDAEYRYHAFLTWGWTKHNDWPGNFMPLPSPYLSRFRNRHRERTSSAVFIGTAMASGGACLDPSAEPVQWADYRAWKIDFVRGLAEHPRKALVYRPDHRKSVQLDDEQVLIREAGETPLLGGSLDDAILGCRLMIIDYPGTTLHMALSANIPVVAYWDPDVWPTSEAAQPLFERLETAGILFSDPKEAAAHVNTIWADVPGWWRSREVQDARGAWCDGLARSSRMWWWHWLRAFWRLARTGDGGPSRPPSSP